MGYLKIAVSSMLLLSLPDLIIAEDSSQSDLTLKELLIGSLANVERLKSGRGELVWTVSGDYFNAPADRPATMKALFMFSGPATMKALFMFSGKKLRYDQEYDYGVRPRKTARNENREFRVLESDEKVQPYVYSQPIAMASKSCYSGEVIDFKRLTEMWQAGYQDVLKAIEAGVIDGNVSRMENGNYLATIQMDKENTTVYKLEFAPSQGFGLVREEIEIHGILSNRIERSFRQEGGLWVLKSMDWVRFKLKSNEVVGRAKIVVEKFSPNVDIPDEMFELRGLGLPPHAYVVDEVKKLRYRLDPLAEIEKTAKDIMDRVDGAERPAEDMVKAEAPESTHAPLKINKTATEPASGSRFDFRDNGRWYMAAGIMAGVVIISVCILAAVRGYRRKGAR